MPKKVLITGISGFAGSHLAEYLLQNRDYKISGTYLTEESLQYLSEIKQSIELVRLDLTDQEKVFETIASLQPDIVFHLAALSSPAQSFKKPAEVITNNAVAEINLLEAIIANKLQETRILIVSSADVYGRVTSKNLPIDEETPFMPIDPYAVSKLTQDFLGLQYALSYNLSIIRARPFNHIGPRQSPNFAIPAFAKKIAEIEKGKREPVLLVGNLDAKRDFTNVFDMVAAYTLLLEKGKIGDVYNIGSGVSHAIKDIVDTLLSFASMPIVVKTDPSLLRPVDIPELRANSKKFQELTGWKPTISLEDSLKETLDYWRKIA